MASSNASLARRWLGAFGAGFSVIVALLAASIATPPPGGDLTRIGMLSERAFGWHGEEPAIDPSLLVDSPIAEADVLVIGDSFSLTRRWQTRLAADGLRVATTSWQQHGHALCGDLGFHLARAGFRGRLVIIESVERMVAERLEASRRCERSPEPDPALGPARPRPVPGPLAPSLEPNWEAPLLLGWNTWRTTRRVLRGDGDEPAEGETDVRRVPDGCERFTNRRCDLGLFYAHDRQKAPPVPADVATLRAIASQVPVPVLWVVMPNKSSVYLGDGRGDAFARALADAGLGPDLWTFARRERLALRDFYLPNDTHLSSAGELRLGDELLAAARARLAPP